jgi:hypothetical protein
MLTAKGENRFPVTSCEEDYETDQRESVESSLDLSVYPCSMMRIDDPLQAVFAKFQFLREYRSLSSFAEQPAGELTL